MLWQINFYYDQARKWCRWMQTGNGFKLLSSVLGESKALLISYNYFEYLWFDHVKGSLWYSCPGGHSLYMGRLRLKGLVQGVHWGNLNRKAGVQGRSDFQRPPVRNFVRGTQRRTVFCKISVRRGRCCLEFSVSWGRLKISRWRSIRRTIFEAYLINFLQFSKVLFFHLTPQVRLFFAEKKKPNILVFKSVMKKKN